MRIAPVAALALLALPFAAFAQLNSTQAVAPLTLELSPENPAPYGTLTITPESSVINLDAAAVTISVNGKKVSSGNDAPVSITLPGPGIKTTINATASVGGATYSASTSVFPGSIALIEEPLSFAPALYPGKPLVPDGGSVRLVAIADFETSPGASIASSNIVYTWSQDGSTLDSASGIGRSSIVVDAPLQYRSSTVTVTAENQAGTIVGSASTVLTSQEPTLRLYQDDPLEGIIFDTALSGTFAVGSGATLIAIPYSFGTDTGSPQVNWFLNGAAAQSGSTITLRPTGSGSGSASLSANASGSGTQAATSLSITFGSSGNSLFGL